MKKTHNLLILLFTIFTSNLSFSQCNPPSAFETLEINNISAMLMNGGDFWWDGIALPGYEYPKGSSRTALYSGGIWLSGIADNGDLLTAAMKYRTSGFEFYPGPINSSIGAVTNNSCSVFNRFWKVSRGEIQNHLDNVSAGLPVALSQIDDVILKWPAKGNVHFISYNIEDELAPFVDLNNNNIYDPENGDYPDIKGDLSIFWVINDIGGIHGNSNGNPMGVEIQFLAYAYYDPSSAVNDATFYDVKVTKKTSGNVSDFYFGLFVDPDLGNPQDDFIGCDSMTNSGYVYNGDAFDDDYSGRPGYGNYAPIVSTTFLNKTMTSFSYLNASSPFTGSPTLPFEYRNYLKGFWRDGSPKTVGGIGYGGTISTSFTYFDNPALSSPSWSEVSALNVPGDRKYIQSSGPHSLDYMTSFEISFVTIAHPNSGSVDVGNSVLPTVAQISQLYTDSLAKGNSYDFNVGINAVNHDLITIYPNPVTSTLSLEFHGVVTGVIKLLDLNGRVIYQVDDNQNKNNIQIDMSNFENGVYLLSIETNTENRFYKILNSQN